MADALVAPAVAGTLYACSTAAAAYSVRQVRLDTDTKKIPVMGVMGAFVFATQMITSLYPELAPAGICAAVCCFPLSLAPMPDF